MKPTIKILVVIAFSPILAVSAIALFGTTEAEPVAWSPPQAPKLEGAYQANNALADAHVFGSLNLLQPESIAVGPDGLLYTGMNTGEIVVLDPAQLAVKDQPQTAPFKLFANTGGRPLGMDFHPDGSLIVADAKKGLVKVEPNGQVSVLSNSAEDLPFGFTDDVVVSSSGKKAWFSDASSKFPYPKHVLDVLEHGGNGRILEYDFETRQTKVVAKGLQFANGVELSEAEDFLLVNETGSYRIIKIWLAGAKQGETEVFAGNLPGFPDNIRRGSDGLFWVAIPALRDPLIDTLAGKPGVRKVIAKILEHVQFPVKSYAMALAFNSQGEVVHNLQAPSAGGYFYITQATPVDGRLYFNSVHNNGMAWVSLPH